MKLVVDIPKDDLDFFSQFIQRMKGAKMEASTQHIVISKKEYEAMCEELEMKHDVIAFKKAVKEGRKGSITIAEYKKQRTKRKVA
ncbi:MAG: hypothetical protein ACKVOR_06125 [Flavobacteriales bacterium]